MSAESSTSSTALPAGSQSGFGRAAMAIFATMVLLIVALTGILVETTWREPSSAVETAPNDQGSVART